MLTVCGIYIMGKENYFHSWVESESSWLFLLKKQQFFRKQPYEKYLYN